MRPDKVVKKEFKLEASKNPDKYYATQALKAEGYGRKQCKKCKLYFWSVQKDRVVCGDASCSGGFQLFDNNPSKVQLSYVDVWKQFQARFEKFGYTPVDRFPVIARWNPTADFVMASIAAFQPFVVSGEAKPPAKKLVIPQFCLRFGDVANVGVTMSHMTGFVMIGQHQFVSPQEWDQDKAFREIFSWLTNDEKGLGLAKEEITFHEDAWAGGGNFGPCMEYFSRGVELGNQVYMMFEQDEELPEGRRELQLKVLDMGMGMERNAWFSQASPTIYDAVFPKVIKELVAKTQVDYDPDFIRKYGPYGAYLNLDEVDDIQKAWHDVADKMSVDVDTLKKKLHPMTALYSIAEHARSLLFALSDGGLPSNVGGGYNLRVILRRALGFIEEFGWDIELADVCSWHAEELASIFPELKASLPDVQKILAVEKQKFLEGRERNKNIIANELKNGLPTVEKLLELYDSRGITPEEIAAIGITQGQQIDVPENFYSLVADLHDQKEQKAQTKKQALLPIDHTLPQTQILYYEDWKQIDFDAKILQILDVDNNANMKYVILDKTAFYPTSGGQLHDTGTLAEGRVSDVFKQGHYVVHVVEHAHLVQNQVVHGTIDFDRRKQLTQHHTATHVINGAAKSVLGNHIWQGGAAKTVQKARLDISHFAALTPEETQAIETKANEIVKQDIPVLSTIQPRDVAEKEHGFVLYQGGAVPGADIRVVQIPNFDTEACGGTHVRSTGEIEGIKIIKTSKVQDGTIRIEFTAGAAAAKESQAGAGLLHEAATLLECTPKQVPARANELFTKWKKAKKGKLSLADFVLTSSEESSGDALVEAATILKTQPEHVVKTIKKFKDQLNAFEEKAK